MQNVLQVAEYNAEIGGREVTKNNNNNSDWTKGKSQQNNFVSFVLLSAIILIKCLIKR